MKLLYYPPNTPEWNTRHEFTLVNNRETAAIASGGRSFIRGCFNMLVNTLRVLMNNPLFFTTKVYKGYF
jgi:hypothetical protein